MGRCDGLRVVGRGVVRVGFVQVRVRWEGEMLMVDKEGS